MNDHLLIGLAILVAVALVTSIVHAVCSRRTQRMQQRAIEELARQITATGDALGEVKSGIAALATHAAGESAAERQRFDTLVQQVRETGRATEEQRREIAQQLEQQRQTVDARLGTMSSAMSERLGQVQNVVDRQLADIRTDTNTQLDRMRATVDEKLQKTLNERITQSFALVTDRLQQVDQGLGEMKTLAADVGGLKRVLSNVKTRGIVGEVQLAAILREILAPGQYEENVATVPGSTERVEFAVRLPGERDEVVYLPIDSKFPGDAYEHLRDAQDAGDTAAVDAAWKALETRLRTEAKAIHDKYLAPPATTTFGIMFLPFEGLYAEVAGRTGLIERLQRDFHVNIAGPSTMAALLNSLEMGFQTVAIQRRANEIQTVLAAVKTEFSTYQGMLERAQRQLGTASKTIDSLVGTRSRAMERKLRSITQLEDPAEAERILGVHASDGDEDAEGTDA